MKDALYGTGIIKFVCSAQLDGILMGIQENACLSAIYATPMTVFQEYV